MKRGPTDGALYGAQYQDAIAPKAPRVVAKLTPANPQQQHLTVLAQGPAVDATKRAAETRRCFATRFKSNVHSNIYVTLHEGEIHELKHFNNIDERDRYNCGPLFGLLGFLPCTCFNNLLGKRCDFNHDVSSFAYCQAYPVGIPDGATVPKDWAEKVPLNSWINWHKQVQMRSQAC